MKQQQVGATFTTNQRWGLDHIHNAAITPAEPDRPPSTDRSGIDGFLLTFGDDQAATLRTDPNRNLTA
ncbi:hypothetical protein SAMN04489712_10447 [Thermomonospora echinospora]|uniref:Uncharacterized protein n=1 Tax=Thermomonospora echinospora TaxID=1992 RepID=A0A1H5YJC5_9ACTN|nr:hypothetical protein [Thermomonospora echinospora]SEG24211.1 hypothetical protein SAMN04489712_10447 [Thermomonospora echinospora]